MSKEHREPFVLPPAASGIQRSPHAQYLLASKADQDAAKRISEQYALHLQANPGTEVYGHCFPIMLADGSAGTGGIYPNKAVAAVAMGARSRDAAYVFLGPHTLQPWDALQFLWFFREAKAKGWAIADPDYIRNKQNRKRIR